MSRSLFMFFLFSVEMRDPGTHPSILLSSIDYTSHLTTVTINIVNIVFILSTAVVVRPLSNLLHKKNMKRLRDIDSPFLEKVWIRAGSDV